LLELTEKKKGSRKIMKKGPGTQGSMGLERSIGFVSYTTYHWATKKLKHFKLDLKLAQAKM
jgi:hypothetical protein